MMHRRQFNALTTLAGVVASLSPSASLAMASKKNRSTKHANVVYILADDLGYGDLSIMGQKKFQTPNIDRIGKEGVVFTDHYSGNTVCSPSRANLMTGQHPGHVACRSNATPMELKHLDPDMVTLPRLFKNAGYATGAFGKWGLGTTSEEGRANPMTHGFDVFSGWKSQTIAHTYYPSTIVRNGREESLEEGTFIHDLIMEDARGFIDKSVKEGKPFFAYIPTAVPHAAMHAPKELHDKWRKKLPEFEEKIGRYGAGPEKCPPVTNPVAGFAAMMENLDHEIGSLLDLLEERGVDGETLVMFASDNGAHKEGGHDPWYWDSNGPLRGHKRDYYDGGIRSPFLARWPGTIKAGTKSDHISAFWDVLPSMAELTGQPIPGQSDGISFMPALLGKADEQKKHEYLYWEDSIGPNIRKRAIRQGDWKGVQKYSKGKKNAMELFNLGDDIGEQNDIAGKHPDVVKRLEALMDEAHKPAVGGK